MARFLRADSPFTFTWESDDFQSKVKAFVDTVMEGKTDQNHYTHEARVMKCLGDIQQLIFESVCNSNLYRHYIASAFCRDMGRFHPPERMTNTRRRVTMEKAMLCLVDSHEMVYF